MGNESLHSSDSHEKQVQIGKVTLWSKRKIRKGNKTKGGCILYWVFSGWYLSFLNCLFIQNTGSIKTLLMFVSDNGVKLSQSQLL